MKGMILALCPLIALFAGTTAARAANQYSGSYSAAMTQHSLTSDTSLSDPDWARGQITASTGAFEDLTTRSAAPFKTAAYVLYDAQNLYVAFDIQQPVPITANQTTNNVGFGLDDFVGIGLDTSGNGSTVYYFETTPRGTRYQQASENSRYNPVWRAAAKAENGRWVAVLTIPLSSLHYSSSSTQAWRFNFVRGVAATSEHYTWAFDGTMQDGTPPAWPTFGDAQFWPHLGIRLTRTGNLFRDRARADAYVLGSAGADRKLFAQANGTFKPQAARLSGVDLSYALTETIHFVATLNPDFSNVEVDQQTIAPQEFRRQLREYRPFFAQGARFLYPNSPSNGALQPNNQIFYSPAIGPFDRGTKVEGAFGDQSFGVLSFRGYDQTTGNVFDDVAYGYTHALPDQRFRYWSDGVIAHHSLAGNDTAIETGMDFKNVRSGWGGGIDEAFESGSYVRHSAHPRSLNVWQILAKPNYTAFVDYGNITPDYNPIDGFTLISDTRGLVYDINFTGSSTSFKNYALNVGQDRYFDESGAVHQSDTVGILNTTLKNQFSISAGMANGELRSYTTAAPGALGCNDPGLVRTAYTGFPNYYCRRSDKFEQLSIALGYRDGTQAPTDFSYAEGPFGGTFLQQYSVSATRQLGSRFSIAAQFGSTEGRAISSGTRTSQWLRFLSLGDNLGPDSNVALELRSVTGLVDGVTTVPGFNIAVSYHSKFASGNEFYMAFGTPAATQTLNRFVVKYILHAGTQN